MDEVKISQAQLEVKRPRMDWPTRIAIGIPAGFIAFYVIALVAVAAVVSR